MPKKDVKKESEGKKLYLLLLIYLYAIKKEIRIIKDIKKLTYIFLYLKIYNYFSSKYMIKLFFISLILFVNLAFADFSKFEIVEIKPSTKEGEVKYGIVLSGTDYNKSAKSIIVAPVVLQQKNYTGKYVMEVKNENTVYVVFIDKLRTVQKNTVIKKIFQLNKKDAKNMENKLNELFKNA